MCTSLHRKIFKIFLISCKYGRNRRLSPCFNLAENPFGLFRQFLQSAARIICSPQATKFHIFLSNCHRQWFHSIRCATHRACSLRCFFCQAHVLTENDSDSIRCEAFYDLTGGSPFFFCGIMKSKNGNLCLTKTPLLCIMCHVADVPNGSGLRWEHSSAGRASALQAGGHRFEPYCSHHFIWPGGAVG